MKRVTKPEWRNLDPWEMCGQDKYCKRDCRENGGCINGCIVPTLYVELAKREDKEQLKEEMKDLLDYVDCNSLNAISGLLRHIGMDKESDVLLRIEEKIILTIERRMTSEIHKEM